MWSVLTWKVKNQHNLCLIIPSGALDKVQFGWNVNLPLFHPWVWFPVYHLCRTRIWPPLPWWPLHPLTGRTHRETMKEIKRNPIDIARVTQGVPFLTFSVVQLLRYSGSTLPMLPFSGNIWITSNPDSVAEKQEDDWHTSKTVCSVTSNYQLDSSWNFPSLSRGLTSPAKRAGQLAAQESASYDGDGLRVSWNFVQGFKVVNLQVKHLTSDVLGSL